MFTSTDRVTKGFVSGFVGIRFIRPAISVANTTVTASARKKMVTDYIAATNCPCGRTIPGFQRNAGLNCLCP